MAEERLIDDDKDRKYKIRKNADGEEELVLNGESEETEVVEEEVTFEVPDLDGDEEAAVMTPEQLAAREQKREEEKAKKLSELSEYLEKSESLLGGKNYEEALLVIDAALELGINDGKAYALKLRALTCDFEDFSKTEECNEALDGFNNFASEEVKSAFASYVPALTEKKAALKEETEKLDKENEEQKDLRRVKFKSKRNIGAILFAVTGVPLIVFAVLAVYYSTIMHAVKDGSNITLFFVFLGIAIAFFIATLITARNFWGAAKLLKRNESNFSTKLGRELEGKKASLKIIDGILSAVGKENDIS